MSSIAMAASASASSPVSSSAPLFASFSTNLDPSLLSSLTSCFTARGVQISHDSSSSSESTSLPPIIPSFSLHSPILNTHRFDFLLLPGEQFESRLSSTSTSTYTRTQFTRPLIILVHGILRLIQNNRNRQRTNNNNNNNNDNDHTSPLSSFSALHRRFASLWFSTGGALHLRATDSIAESIEYIGLAIESLMKFIEEEMKNPVNMNQNQNHSLPSVRSLFPLLSSDHQLSLVRTGRSAAMRGAEAQDTTATAASGSARFISLRHSWINYLSVLPGLSEEKSRTIANQYPTFGSLIAAYQRCESNHERELMLADIPIQGGNSMKRRRIGPVNSKRVYAAMYQAAGVGAGVDASEDVDSEADEADDPPPKKGRTK
jgi:hypothetical protein